MNHCPVTHDLNRHLDEYDRAQAIAEQIDRRIAEMLKDPAKVAEADSWIAGTLDYDNIERDLADLWLVPGDKWAESVELERIRDRAEAAHAARMAQLREMAEDELAQERDADLDVWDEAMTLVRGAA